MPDIEIYHIDSAIGELHSKTGKWPTRDQLADYLGCEISIVKNGLKELRRRKVMRDRRREGETRWMPWSEL